MLVLAIGSLLLSIVSTERALPTYDLDAGLAPEWLADDADKIAAAAVERWYVDKATATCKPFKYLGSLGNFNNFVSKAVCETHLIFTPEEKADSCAEDKSEGSCELAGDSMKSRWYFKVGSQDNKENVCHEFKYNGCGGNANNFESDQECKNYCQNMKNGGVGSNTDASTLTTTPNAIDCLFVPAIKTATPKMGIVPRGNKCVYSAIGKDAKRGFFDDLPTCVKTCIVTKVDACAADGPYQVPITDEKTDMTNINTYYYFNSGKKLCLPFMSLQPTTPVKVDEGADNIFSSVEMCASFCPATGHLGPLKAVEACKEQKDGESTNADKYKLPRFHYDSTVTTEEKCVAYQFNGKDLNLNNFVSKSDCEKICRDPLKTA